MTHYSSTSLRFFLSLFCSSGVVLFHCWLNNGKGIRLVKNPAAAVQKVPIWEIFGDKLAWSNSEKAVCMMTIADSDRRRRIVPAEENPDYESSLIL